jgi:hypothetical protein
MARNAQQVRRNIAANAVALTTRILDDLRTMRGLQVQRASLGADGDFIDADFESQGDLAHLTPTIATGLLDEAKEVLDELELDNGHNYFLQARRG